MSFNPLNAELNPICHFLALLGAHPILHVSRIRVKTKKIQGYSGDNICLRNDDINVPDRTKS